MWPMVVSWIDLSTSILLIFETRDFYTFNNKQEIQGTYRTIDNVSLVRP